MAIEYKSLVPWGRSYDEYIKMFNLTEDDLKKHILGCGDGPAAFNAQLTKRNGKVVSIDPIYKFSKEQIQDRINETFNVVMEQTKSNSDKFVWTNIKNIDELGQTRMKAMKEFISDYELGKTENRYIYGELPDMPSFNSKFDIALSSHFLFLYSDNLSYEFHEKSIEAMLNVSHEVRIFPILDNNANKSKYVDSIKYHFENNQYFTEEKIVDYEFQKNGNIMLRIWKEQLTTAST